MKSPTTHRTKVRRPLTTLAAFSLATAAGGLAHATQSVDLSELERARNPMAEILAPRTSIPMDNISFSPGTSQEAIDAVEYMISQIPGQTAAFSTTSRWAGGVNGDPITLTWSFVQDSVGGSTLFATLDAAFGSRQAWVSLVQEGFDRWEEVSGLDFERITFQSDWDDPSVAWGADGIPGRAGDIRIRMRPLTGNALAIGNPPFGVAKGDITLASNVAWPVPFQGYQYTFENTLMHSVGHSVGLDLTCPLNGTKLMEPGITTNPIHGPQHDDVRGAHDLYGDALEPNDFRAEAPYINLAVGAPIVDLSEISTGPGIYGPTGPTGKLSIDRVSDVDYFHFQYSEAVTINVLIDDVGVVYGDEQACSAANQGNTTNSLNQGNLSMDLVDRAGTVISSTTSSGVLTRYLPHINVPYYIRVRTTSSSMAGPQLYKLRVYITPAPGCDLPCDDGDARNGQESCENGQCVVTYVADCNENFVEDSFDILSGTSMDVLGDGIPDECQDDCNGNSIPDQQELDSTTDQNDNGVLDECETTRYVPVSPAHPNTSYASIGEALAQANTGDTILVGSGTFGGALNRDLNIDDMTVQIVGSGALRTTIDLGGLGRFARVTQQGSENRSTIYGMRFVNGSAAASGQGVYPAGGALWIYGAAATVENCIFEANSSGTQGGAVWVDGATLGLKFRDCLFFDNVSSQAGGGILFAGSSQNTVIGCTFTDNRSGGTGAAIATYDTACYVDSCIVWGNQSLGGPSLDLASIAASVVRYCDLAPGELATWQGQGQSINNFSANPRYVSRSGNDYRLRPASPCRNTGNPIFSNFGNSYDLTNGRRVFEGRMEVGADETE